MGKNIKKLLQFSIGPIISAILGFIMTTLLSHIVQPNQFGMASMYNVANTLITIIVLMGIDQAFMREYHEEESKEKLLFNSIIIPLLNTILIGIVLILFKNSISNLLFNTESVSNIIVLLAVSMPLFIIEKIILIYIRMQEKAIEYSMWNIFSRLLNLIITISMLLFYKNNFYSIIFGTIVSQLIISMVILNLNSSIFKSFFKNFDQKIFGNLFKYGLPIMPAVIIGWGLNSMDLIFLKNMSNYSEVGLYSMGYKIMAVVTIIQSTFTTFWAPVAFKWKKQEQDNDKFEYVNRMVTFGMCFVFIMIMMFKWLLPLFVNENYYLIIYIIPFLILYPIFYTISETTTLGISFSRKSHYNVIVSIVSVIVNGILNYILIPFYGAIGAAIATGISYFVFFVTRTLISRRLWYKFPIKKTIFSSLIVIIVATANTFIYDLVIISIFNFIVLLIICSIYKNDIILLLKNGKKKICVIAFDTQIEQICSMINNEEYMAVSIDIKRKNKFTKFIESITKMVLSDAIYFGFGLSESNNYFKIAKMMNKKIILHWIGTDVLIAKSSKYFKLIQKNIAVNFSCSELICKELNELGTTSTIIPILPNIENTTFATLPEEHAVLVYLPDGKEEFYGGNYIYECAKCFPNILFYIVANNKKEYQLNNIVYVGKLNKNDMAKLYDKISILVRMPKHDGLSLMLLESLIKGKEVIYSYKFPYTHYAKNLNSLIKQMKKIVDKKPTINERGHNYIFSKFNQKDIKLNLQNEIRKVIGDK